MIQVIKVEFNIVMFECSHHVYEKRGKEVLLQEVGPRFELKLYQIKLGTVDQDDADTEWSLRPFMRTSRKRKAL
jgi:U3 small nucleolar ribonucleoprotein protein IMP4